MPDDDLPRPACARLITVCAAARMLSLSRSTLYNLMDRGELAYVRIGRARRIPPAEIDRLIRDALIGGDRAEGGASVRSSRA